MDDRAVILGQTRGQAGRQQVSTGCLPAVRLSGCQAPAAAFAHQGLPPRTRPQAPGWAGQVWLRTAPRSSVFAQSPASSSRELSVAPTPSSFPGALRLQSPPNSPLSPLPAGRTGARAGTGVGRWRPLHLAHTHPPALDARAGSPARLRAASLGSPSLAPAPLPGALRPHARASPSFTLRPQALP